MCLARELPAARPVSEVKARWADICDSDSEEESTDLETRAPACRLPPGSWTEPSASLPRSVGWTRPPKSDDRTSGHDGQKLQCQFIVGIEEEARFRVAGRVLGRAGANVKAIAAETGARLRLRGRGSKFLEGPLRQESQDPLMLCVSAPSRAAYEEAVRRITEILQRVYVDYWQFCTREALPLWCVPQVQLHEGPRVGAW